VSEDKEVLFFDMKGSPSKTAVDLAMEKAALMEDANKEDGPVLVRDVAPPQEFLEGASEMAGVVVGLEAVAGVSPVVEPPIEVEGTAPLSPVNAALTGTLTAVPVDEDDTLDAPDYWDDTLSLPYEVGLLDDRILVRRDEAAEEIGGIVIPQIAKDRPMVGTVVRVGPGARVHWFPWLRAKCSLSERDRVLVSRYAGNEFTFDTGEDAPEYTVLREAEVLGVVRDEEDDEDA